ncbi:MAG: hypothetical protein HQK99_15370 [Nitrospirae bacterium]|nr:hypothetical protein [Nitrospirota bacterium]
MGKYPKGILIMWLIAVGLAFTIVPFKGYRINILGIEISSGQSYGFVFNPDLPFANISFSIIFIEVVLISIFAVIVHLVINRK